MEPKMESSRKFKTQTGQKAQESSLYIKKSEGEKQKRCLMQEFD